jgi:alkanesulfonate monooxygenase SsuD/methylene tetrahydromethanopterin reductase-like flavin-dependent oxidoreductase (luciferase family)
MDKGDAIDAPRGAGRRGFAIPATPDLELAATVAASGEELGYASVWTNDAPPGDGLEVAGAMLAATEAIRVGIGAVPCDRRSPAGVAEQLLAASLPLERLVLVVGSGGSGSVEVVRRAVTQLRDTLGDEIAIGVAAMAPRMCRLGGEIADLVLLNWMTPERIVWARRQVRRGAAGRAPGLRAPEPELACYIRVSLGQGAALRVGAEAAHYGAMPAYAQNFSAMGVAAVGIAAVDASEALPMVEPYEQVLDEAIVRPIVKVPSSRRPELDEAVEALGVIMEIEELFAPRPRESTPDAASFNSTEQE